MNETRSKRLQRRGQKGLDFNTDNDIIFPVGTLAGSVHKH
jgi:hypothetical protein